jgi:hypothetical protein
LPGEAPPADLVVHPVSLSRPRSFGEETPDVSS